MEPVILVKLKMRKIYKTFLTFIGILIILTSSVGVLYLFYDKVVTSSDIEVNGALSINYVDGKNFTTDGLTKINFSISNSSEDVQYYNVVFTKIRGNGHYRLLYNDTIVNEGDLKTIDEITTDYISIDALETKIYTLEVSSEDNIKGIINVRLQNGKTETFADTILKNSPPSDNSLTNVGIDLATDDEGLIKSIDDIGVSYYYRGNVSNNYVSFANKLWRIVRINGDGTVRLILDEAADGLANYYAQDSTDYNYHNSYIHTFLDTWATDNLRNYTNYVASTKFCNDISTNSGNEYLTYIRIVTNKIPTFNCLSNAFNDSIGLLSIDEVIMAGATPDSANRSFYLYNSSINDAWYTMSGAKGSVKSLNLFMFDQYGKVRSDIIGSTYHAVRPVVNLIKNIAVSGSGKIDDPYKIIEE